MGKQTRVQELLGAKARREREFEKAMRASMAGDEGADGSTGIAPAPAPAAEKPGSSKPVKVG
jgi:hypothetical protein